MSQSLRRKVEASSHAHGRDETPSTTIVTAIRLPPWQPQLPQSTSSRITGAYMELHGVALIRHGCLSGMVLLLPSFSSLSFLSRILLATDGDMQLLVSFYAATADRW